MSERFCYYIPAGIKRFNERGFIPSAVFEDEAGHKPMTGGPDQVPWVWGPSFEDAVATARHKNKGIGLTSKDVNEIIASSMRL